MQLAPEQIEEAFVQGESDDLTFQLAWKTLLWILGALFAVILLLAAILKWG